MHPSHQPSSLRPSPYPSQQQRPSMTLSFVLAISLFSLSVHSQNVNLTNCDPLFGCTDFTGVTPGGPNNDANCQGIPGYFQLTSPNATSIIAVGNRLLVNWTYALTNPRYPNNSISIYYALIGTSQSSLNQITVTPATWYSSPVVEKLPKGTTQFEWILPNLQTGKYQLRIVGDDLDPYLSQSRGQIACIREGQPLPKTTALFRVVGNSQLNDFQDGFGPSSGARGMGVWIGVGAVVAGWVGSLLM
ncbi:hypothetical protein HDU97_003751 [Phlyctochytrium planicorne]|nr:hypothetical protein HDU97_003751 [Phlyctochytrium planicorne]